MEKKTYYIAVGSGEMQEPEEATGNFEFEIQATEEEVDKLQDMFEELAMNEEDTAVRATIQYREYRSDKENDAHDGNLTEIYRMLHELGTPDTRKHIEAMNVLPRHERL
ncbi:hypothetical protein SAMN04487970_100329 [Paenibacillus tianmuensis]|uniref:Uncharacterized protein n=1 Tax=Paenibacillus tianmuensis TaxID=624147 RepID=A0A1G4PLE0_9BACL|nr:hypothetical protein [Paenibacillus tianmuensis]SCW32899.1 hypothetical protein SAMN04487970_100329 [Paenibacillus tianmuensis]